MNYYNEYDSKTAAWLKQLITEGLIPHGDVDTRSITEVTAGDLSGYTQCHFFAGIGGWGLALQLAGWPATRPVWTGSCPCQPFSTAGKQKGTKDERHLWPDFFNLISQCRPKHVFGEQVASAIGHGWLDGVSSDLESEGYACGASVLGAHSVGAPHIRQRLYWVANAKLQYERSTRPHEARQGDVTGMLEAGWKRVIFSSECDESGNCPECGIDYSDCVCPGPTQDGVEYKEIEGVMYGRMANGEQQGLEGQPRTIDNRNQFGRIGQESIGSIAESGAVGGLVLTNSDGCSQGSCSTRTPRYRGSIDAADGGIGRIGNPNGQQANPTKQGQSLPSAGLLRCWNANQPIQCRDGKTRRIPTEPAFFPLAHGIPARVVRLRGYGNAIVPQVAAEFIQAFLDTQE